MKRVRTGTSTGYCDDCHPEESSPTVWIRLGRGTGHPPDYIELCAKHAKQLMDKIAADLRDIDAMYGPAMIDAQDKYNKRQTETS